MKKFIIAVLSSIPLLGLALNARATSTVMLDMPDFPAFIGNVYTVAQPIFSSIWWVVAVIVGIGLVFGLIRLIMSKFTF